MKSLQPPFRRYIREKNRQVVNLCLIEARHGLEHFLYRNVFEFPYQIGCHDASFLSLLNARFTASLSLSHPTNGLFNFLEATGRKPVVSIDGFFLSARSCRLHLSVSWFLSIHRFVMDGLALLSRPSRGTIGCLCPRIS